MHSEALEQLYRDHYGAALLYTLSCCRDRALAEDIVSEAFEKALLVLEEGREGFRWWLLAVCRNLWMDEYRRRARRGYALLEEQIPTLNGEGLEELLREERYAALYRAIGKLGRRQRELLSLYYFSGLPLTKVAGLLSISYTAAKTGLLRARVQLRQKMEEDGYGTL